MSKIKGMLFFSGLAMFLSCQRNNMSGTGSSHKLITDSTSLSLPFTSGNLDSFSVISNSDWAISLSGNAANILKLDKSSGTGNSRIHVTVIKANTADSVQKAVIKVSVINDPNLPPINLLVQQATSYDGDTSRNAYGGSFQDEFYSAAITADGGSVLVGFSKSMDGDLNGFTGLGSMWIARTDFKGKLLWQNKMGTIGNEAGLYVIASPAGGYLISSITQSNLGGFDAWILKIDESGNVEWQKIFGGSKNDIAFVAMATPDGGYVLGGETNSTDHDLKNNYGGYDAWILKIDAHGNKIWSRSFGGTMNEIIYGATISHDNNYIFCGETSSNDHDVSGLHGASDYWVIKLDTAGNLIWQHTFGGSGTETLPNIVRSNSGGYIITGESNSTDGDATGNHGSADCLLVKIDEAGNKIWSRMIGGSANDFGTYISATPYGHYLIGGSSNSIDGDINTGNRGLGDGWVFEIDEDGHLLWQKTMGGSGDDVVWNVFQTSSGKFILNGVTNSADGDVRGAHGGNDGWISRFH